MVRVCQDLIAQAFSGVLDGIPSGNDLRLSLGVAHNTTKSLDFGKNKPPFSSEIEIGEGDQNLFRSPKLDSRADFFSTTVYTFRIEALCAVRGAFE
jgi:hypothetical protein